MQDGVFSSSTSRFVVSRGWRISVSQQRPERIQEVFDQIPEVLDTGITYTGPSKLKGAIRCENVIFGYTPDRPVLKGINVDIPAGKKIGIVGLSGGGKTTLIKLIPRFYEVQQGAVMIDGMDNRYY